MNKQQEQDGVGEGEGMAEEPDAEGANVYIDRYNENALLPIKGRYNKDKTFIAFIDKSKGLYNIIFFMFLYLLNYFI